MSCLHHHSFKAAMPAPFLSYTVYSSGFSMLCNPVISQNLAAIHFITHRLQPNRLHILPKQLTLCL